MANASSNTALENNFIDIKEHEQRRRSRSAHVARGGMHSTKSRDTNTRSDDPTNEIYLAPVNVQSSGDTLATQNPAASRFHGAFESQTRAQGELHSVIPAYGNTQHGQDLALRWFPHPHRTDVVDHQNTLPPVQPPGRVHAVRRGKSEALYNQCEIPLALQLATPSDDSYFRNVHGWQDYYGQPVSAEDTRDPPNLLLGAPSQHSPDLLQREEELRGSIGQGVFMAGSSYRDPYDGAENPLINPPPPLRGSFQRSIYPSHPIQPAYPTHHTHQQKVPLHLLTNSGQTRLPDQPIMSQQDIPASTSDKAVDHGLRDPRCAIFSYQNNAIDQSRQSQLNMSCPDESVIVNQTAPKWGYIRLGRNVRKTVAFSKLPPPGLASIQQAEVNQPTKSDLNVQYPNLPVPKRRFRDTTDGPHQFRGSGYGKSHPSPSAESGPDLPVPRSGEIPKSVDQAQNPQACGHPAITCQTPSRPRSQTRGHTNGCSRTPTPLRQSETPYTGTQDAKQVISSPQRARAPPTVSSSVVPPQPMDGKAPGANSRLENIQVSSSPQRSTTQNTADAVTADNSTNHFEAPNAPKQVGSSQSAPLQSATAQDTPGSTDTVITPPGIAPSTTRRRGRPRKEVRSLTQSSQQAAKSAHTPVVPSQNEAFDETEFGVDRVSPHTS
ncbi:MAG: hypothetical protein LQ340_005581 [Diploschistes diacapsis]|nr:MAG: hypothetical protein LQ340_005581 [Diploschistes diacapsis]